MKRHIEAELEFETYYGTVSFEAGRWCRLLIDIEMKRRDINVEVNTQEAGKTWRAPLIPVMAMSKGIFAFSEHCNAQQSSRAVSEASISWQLIGDGRIQKTFTPIQVANSGDHRDYANQYDCQDSTICNDTYQLIGRHRAPQRKSLRMICSDI